MVDDARLNEILDQLPGTFSIIESLRAKFGVSIKIAKFEVEYASNRNESTIRRIRRLESYLDRNGLINNVRPRRTPHRILNGSQYWWVRETFKARKVVIPTPVLLDKLGIIALSVWISEPKPAPKPRHNWDWTGSFLYLPTVHYEKGKTDNCVSGCSALQFIINATQDKPLFTKDWDEPLGRSSPQHPVDKLAQLGGFVSEERRLQSLYYVRYITDEQSYSVDGNGVRINDLVGYPIYISAYPTTAERKAASSK
jgi:hypothetical protein